LYLFTYNESNDARLKLKSILCCKIKRVSQIRSACLYTGVVTAALGDGPRPITEPQGVPLPSGNSNLTVDMTNFATCVLFKFHVHRYVNFSIICLCPEKRA
jgi:hypothetical protein